jgi:extracellular factor (EF) 3-hydroxypalmitic acid methyl ester biosynthesis protein
MCRGFFLMIPEAAAFECVESAAKQLREKLETAAHATPLENRQALVDDALSGCLSTLVTTGIWGEGNRLLSAQLWGLAGDLLETGWLQARARHKPRGYAGDHELLRRIVVRQVCEHPLGRCFDEYFQAQDAPQAVRNRVELSAGWIVGALTHGRGPACRVAIVGSGPAMEVSLAAGRLPPELRQRLHVILLDADHEALEAATNRLGAVLSRSQVTAIQGNLFRLAQRPSLAGQLHGANLILCTGLFDYLTSPVAAAMLAEFWRQLAPGGAVFVFNFADNFTRAYMEWLGNWYLVYRTRADLAALAAAAGISSDHWLLGAETLGIDLYLAVQKPAS